ncbi:MAG: cell division protein FtsZ [Hyphomicrobium aestuarii]|nr:cell division protein FtsZ [Hyphomicrobium aestuarii]
MSIKLQLPRMMDMRPRLTVMGIGGAGCNAINNMIASGLTGVDFIVANTDAQALSSSSAERRVQLGATLTEGLGAGSKPEVGEAAAEEAIEDLKAQIVGSHMLFIAAGMGGGTGTGAAAVVARAARELGILTVAIVTKPFQFEGARRQRIAEIGIDELRQYVDTLIVIPNQNLFRVATERTTFAEAFVLADQVLYSGVACIVDLIIKEGLINLDFADVRTVLAGMGTAMMGTGEASGARRAIEAAEEAIANPLLDDVSLRGARGLLLSISGGRDLTLYEVDEAASRVRAEVDPEANIIVGATFDESLGDHVRVSIVASGMMRQAAIAPPSSVAPPPVQSAPPFSSGSPVQAATSAQPAPASHHQPQPQSPSRPVHSASPVSLGPSSLGPSSLGQSSLGQSSPGPSPDPQYSDAHHYSDGRSSEGPPRGNAFDGLAETEMQRRLSAAIEMPVMEEFAAAHHGYEGQPEAASQGSPGTWRHGGVTIEETSPLSLQTGAARSDRPSRVPASAQPVRTDEPPFMPELPAEARRQPPRRMPEIEEFPPLAQREFHGRNEPPKKPGLFERLAGMGRRSDDGGRRTHDSRDSRHGEAFDGHAPHDNRNDSSVNARQNAPSSTGTGPRNNGQQTSQDVDMPAVLRKDRR